jgi:UDP-glucose 4-epimerase
MNILVTGGAGYIGSHCVKTLLKIFPEENITVIDNLSEGHRDAVLTSKFYECDLRDKEYLRNVFRKGSFEAVIHFAAFASVPESVTSPHKYYENNIVGSLNLLEAMLESNVKKLIFSSSAAVYGEPISEFIDEEHSKVPTNPYGHSKLIIEEILKWYYIAYKINSISFRYFCAAGADPEGMIGERHKNETHSIPSAILTALGKRETFYVYGNDYKTKDGSGVRDYIHVNDLVDAHIKALDVIDENTCDQMNLGIGKGFTVFDIVNTVKKLSGKQFNVKIAERRAGDPSVLVAKPDKAFKYLNWKPKYTELDDIVESALKFFKLHS